MFLQRLGFLTWREALHFMDCLEDATGTESLSPVTAEPRAGLACFRGQEGKPGIPGQLARSVTVRTMTGVIAVVLV